MIAKGFGKTIFSEKILEKKIFNENILSKKTIVAIYKMIVHLLLTRFNP
jgi:hypothetical protein